MPVPASYCEVAKLRSRYPQSFLEYPLTTNRDATMAAPLLKGRSILEIGAGSRKFLENFDGIYRTMDTDPTTEQDFYSFESITGKYDGVVMREVAEHIPREVFYQYLGKIFDCLNPGGVLVLSTPNPVSAQFWTDYTHISPWPIWDMCCILSTFGFTNISAHRIIWPSRWLWLKQIYREIHARLITCDYAGAYVTIAYKP